MKLGSSSAHSQPVRLGFAVKVMGMSGLRSRDARRWQNSPHLSVSLGYVREILNYMAETDIQMYRLASGLAPYVTHPDHPEFHGQVDECLEELEQLGARANRDGVRLSFHPGQYIVINSPDEDIAARSIADIEAQARILDAMGLGDEAVIVTHVGGAYGKPKEALARFAWRTERLSRSALRRLVVENDDRLFSVEDALLIHKMTGLRVVFDAHHHRCFNPHGIAAAEAARMAIQTWAGWDSRAKIHYSSPRDGSELASAGNGRSAGRAIRAHADYIEPGPFVDFYRSIADLSPDVMLEAKSKDKALLRLRNDLIKNAPDLAAILVPQTASQAIGSDDSQHG
jgi:UV DNA damage endonuclease